jgi:hypothetical protein
MALSLKRGLLYTCSQCSQGILLLHYGTRLEEEIEENIGSNSFPENAINRDEVSTKTDSNPVEQLDLFSL